MGTTPTILQLPTQRFLLFFFSFFKSIFPIIAFKHVTTSRLRQPKASPSPSAAGVSIGFVIAAVAGTPPEEFCRRQWAAAHSVPLIEDDVIDDDIGGVCQPSPAIQKLAPAGTQ